MKILLTGATGYIGKRLLPALIDDGHHVVCCVRDVNRFHPPEHLRSNISVVVVDLLDEASLMAIPPDIDGAYYLVHSMSASSDYAELETRSAKHFVAAMERTQVQHVVYLGGITNENELSEHLASRQRVEEVLRQGAFAFTALRAGIIIGSGSASFEIIRDLVEKLPIMITPRWLRTLCQPIGVTDVISFLTKALFHEPAYHQSFDIGGPDILTYKEMLLGYARARGLKRKIWIVPVMTPRLSSYWLYFVTSTSYKLATALVDSMKIEVICKDDALAQMLDITPIPYDEAIDRALAKIRVNAIASSWKDAYVSSGKQGRVADYIEVPTYGCFIDERQMPMKDTQSSIDKLWRIGGKSGWYYGTWLWRIRGYMDKLVGGVGLRRGRTNADELSAGDALDFWRVVYADRSRGRLILFAEMKLPGEAWLAYRTEGDELIQTATFRPKGLMGRLYWYSVLPFHGFIFKGLLRRLTTAS